MNLIIQPMTIQDLEEISNNLLTDFDSFWTVRVFYSELQNKNSFYLVAKQNMEIVGFGGFTQMVDQIDITNIVTKKNYRNLGIASHILDNLLRIVETKNINCINLEVNETNKSAIHLYEKYHFQKVGIRKNYYPNFENAILMTKYIN